MASLVILYRTPKDPAAFDKHYAETHIPIVKTIPGLRRFEVSRGPVASPGGPSGIYFVATLIFDNMPGLQSALASAEGQAAAADVQKFASGGADMLMFDAVAV